MLFTLFAPAANVNAASKRTKALTAYQKKLKKLDSKIYKFALVYLDKDSIPELVITSKESIHAVYGEIYTYNNGKLKNLKYAGSDFGQFIYSPKKSVACNSSWINGYGAVSTFYRFSKTGKSTKLKRFDARRAICVLSDLDIVVSEKGSGVTIKSRQNASNFIKQFNKRETIESIKEKILCRIQKNGEKISFKTDFSKKRF